MTCTCAQKRVNNQSITSLAIQRGCQSISACCWCFRHGEIEVVANPEKPEQLSYSLNTWTGQLPLPLIPHQSRMHFRWNLHRHSSLPISSPGWNSSMQIVHSCSLPSPSMQSFSVAMYGKIPRERYDSARARALAVWSAAGAPREEGKLGSRGFIGGMGPKLATGSG
jgi:hypothetical protein